jgi:hypothetical protein
MTATQNMQFSLADLLNAANRHYPEGYLSVYFDTTTGEVKSGSGDTLAKSIVCDLRETFDERSSRKQQIATAVHLLEHAKKDIQNAIDGLRELERESQKRNRL